MNRIIGFELGFVNWVHQFLKYLRLVFQNPGMLRGVMQKVNPFKSTSQVTTALSACHSGNGESVSDNKASTQPGFLTQVSKATSSESLEQGQVSDSNQVGEKWWFKMMISSVQSHLHVPRLTKKAVNIDAWPVIRFLQVILIWKTHTPF